jgi:hypothetical protein
VIPIRHHHLIIRICVATFIVAGVDNVAAQREEAQELQAIQTELRDLESRLETQQAEREARGIKGRGG